MNRVQYDTIPEEYQAHRHPDPRIAARICDALGNAATVVNVGAGTGSYEPAGCVVVAVEPSLAMIRGRSPGSAPVIRGIAECLPFTPGAFDAGMAVLTMHHWPSWVQGLRELIRVSRHRVVLLTWDPASPGFWLVEDYFPEIAAIDRQIFPPMEAIRRVVGAAAVHSVPVPWDCTDGFLGAFWRRPHAYLDHNIRAAISSFAKIGDHAEGLARLRHDLDHGAWERRYGHLLTHAALDVGYRIVIAELSGGDVHRRRPSST